MNPPYADGSRQHSLALLIASALFPVLPFVSAQAVLRDVKVDVAGAVQSGGANLTSSPFDIGSVNAIFDGNSNSLARTPNINPAFVQVAYAQPRPLTRFRVLLSYGTSYDWWVEKADSQPDMDSRSGSWGVVTGTNRVTSGSWQSQTLPAAATANLFRLNVRRYGGDGYCHLNEWEHYGDTVIDRLNILPASASMFYGETRQFTVLGHNDALNENYPVDALASWSLVGSIGTLSSNGLFTATSAGAGGVYATVDTLSSSTASIVVQQSQPDIDVLYIERTPRLSFDPANTNYTSGLPAAGQRVLFLAHVKNWGTNSLWVPFEWRFDGTLTTNGSVQINPGQDITVPFAWNWETNSHALEFRADPANSLHELSKLNNSVLIRTDALLVGLWVEQGLYNHFHQTQIALNDGANGFEDWGQRMVRRWNELMRKAKFPASPQGFLDQLALDKIVVVPDGALPLAGGLSGNNPDSRDRTVDMQWGYPWDPSNTNAGAFYGFRWNGPFYIDFGSIHEMNHARYHVDLYALDENHNTTTPNVGLIDDDTGTLVAGTAKMPFIAFDVVYYNKWRDIMGAGSPVFDAYSAAAWNWKHHRRGQGNQNSPPDIGKFLNDLPLTNHVQFMDQNGVPLAGAEVNLYRGTGGFYNKYFGNTPAGLYTADTNGFIQLGRNPFGPTRDFGNSVPDVIFKVRFRNQLYFMFQEVTDFNLQNWLTAGARRQATDGIYIREIDLRDNPTVVPTNSWMGNYFNGGNFDVFVTNRFEPGGTNGLNFSWNDQPAPGVDADGFSVYWEGNVPFTDGWKTFSITADGGLRLYIDHRLVFDQWTNSTLQTWAPVIYTASSSPFVNPGRSRTYGAHHRVEVRYRHESGPARVQLAWADESPPAEVPVNAWRADYYSAKNLSGYVLSRAETAIDYDYQNGSPEPAVGSDNFSARWTGDWDFAPGTTRFTAVTDDGMRVWIDNTLALDRWLDQPPTIYTFTRALSGRHRVRVEYFEGAVTARASFNWMTPPLISAQPQSQTVPAGSDVSFSVSASGFPEPTYQWRFNKQDIPGAQGSTLTLTNVQLTSAGSYTVLVTNNGGFVVSAPAQLTVYLAPVRPSLNQPQVEPDGQFSVNVSGEDGRSYTWLGSTNLADWTPLSTFIYSNGPVRLRDAGATNFPYRFYQLSTPGP